MAKFEFRIDDELIGPEVERDGSSFHARIGNLNYCVYPMGGHLFAIVSNGVRRLAAVARYKDTFYVDIDSALLEVRDAGGDSVTSVAGEQAGAKDKIFAPMPGKIVKIMVAVGDEVQVKQPMVIVEAMKMENQVNAKAKGRVKAINFSAGDQVDTEKPIIELELAG